MEPVTEQSLTNIIIAIGGLGTASYALVDGAKAIFGGPSNHGFKHIKRVLTRLYPDQSDTAGAAGAMTLSSVLDTLYANWINGAVLADQKAIAKSLIKLRLNEDNAARMAEITGVDSKLLVKVAGKMASGKQLEQAESDVLGRFDLVLTAMLDEGYQRADQAYRNSAKMWAIVVSVILAMAGGMIVGMPTPKDWAAAILIGLLATPLAPITKDLTSALQAAVKAMQAVRK